MFICYLLTCHNHNHNDNDNDNTTQHIKIKTNVI